jgi:hypothetical protein
MGEFTFVSIERLTQIESINGASLLNPSSCPSPARHGATSFFFMVRLFNFLKAKAPRIKLSRGRKDFRGTTPFRLSIPIYFNKNRCSYKLVQPQSLFSGTNIP